MSKMHYQLVPCQKCGGDLYGPVAFSIDQSGELEREINKIETEVTGSHPYHRVNGQPLKRYSDFQFPNY